MTWLHQFLREASASFFAGAPNLGTRAALLAIFQRALPMSCVASSIVAGRAIPERAAVTARAPGRASVRPSARPLLLHPLRRFSTRFSTRGEFAARDAVLEPRADAPGAKKVNPEDIPPTALQFMVEMSCGKCVAAVESAVAAVPGVEAVTGALETNTVRVVARLSHADDVIDAITGAGYKARLIGSGDVEAFGEDLARRLGTDLRTLRQSLAAVAEFKGNAYGHGDVTGVVRFVAVNEDTCVVEGALEGLVPGATYAVTVRTYGDTTEGVATTGGIYDASDADGCADVADIDVAAPAAGDLGEVTADADGRATVPARVVDSRVKVWDVIGRSLAVCRTDAAGGGAGAAAVLARSAGVGENLKRVCHCDGTVIFESTPDDFKPSSA